VRLGVRVEKLENVFVLPADAVNGSDGLPLDAFLSNPSNFQKQSTSPTLLSPSSVQVFLDQPTFRWTPTEGARRYRIQVSQDPTFGDPLDDVVTDATSYSSEVARVIASHPDALIWSADPQTTATFMSEYKQLNNGSLPAMVTATDSLTPDFFGALTKVVGTSYVTSSVYLVGSSFSQTTPAFATYKAALKADSKTSAIADVLSAVGPPASAYDGINIMALAMIMAKTTVGSAYNQFVSQVVAPKSGATVVSNFADGATALAAGHQIQYVGVIGAVVFNKYHNAAGEFAANVFAADGSASRVGTISGTQVLGLL